MFALRHTETAVRWVAVPFVKAASSPILLVNLNNFTSYDEPVASQLSDGIYTLWLRVGTLVIRYNGRSLYGLNKFTRLNAHQRSAHIGLHI